MFATSFKVALFDRNAWHGHSEITSKCIKEWELANVLKMFFDNSLNYKENTDMVCISEILFGININFDKTKTGIEYYLPNCTAFLEQAGLVEIRKDNPSGYNIFNEGINTYKLSEEGQRISSLIKLERNIKIRKPKDERNKVFFACAFGNAETEKLFKQTKQSIARLGLETIRIDFEEPNQTITDAIIEEIYESKIMIADLTFARPSVYFEVGIAQGLGMTNILTCREDHFNSSIDNLKIHFDLAQYKISLWNYEKGKINWINEKMKPINRIKNAL